MFLLRNLLTFSIRPAQDLNFKIILSAQKLPEMYNSLHPIIYLRFFSAKMYKLPPYSGSYQCSPAANSTFRGLEKRLPEKPLFPIQFQIYNVARYFFRPSSSQSQ